MATEQRELFAFFKNGKIEPLLTYCDGTIVPKIEKSADKVSKDIILAEGSHGIVVRAARKFKKGEKLFKLIGERMTCPTMYTFQIREQMHINVEGGPEYTCHSCEPTGRFDMDSEADPVLYATRDVDVGEEITFHYCTTEWEMAAPFQCDCGKPSCFGKIQGFKHCTPEQRAKLPREFMSEHIKRRYTDILAGKKL